MLKSAIFIFAALASTAICGFSLITLLAASIALCMFEWFKALSALRLKSAYAVNDPETYNPEIISAALEEALCLARQSRNTFIFQLSNPGINKIVIRVNQSGELKISDANRSIDIESGSAWIADHPLPLALTPGEQLSLRFQPCNYGRVRVSLAAAAVPSSLLYFLTPLFLLFSILNFIPAAASLLAILFYTLLIQRILPADA